MGWGLSGWLAACPAGLVGPVGMGCGEGVHACGRSGAWLVWEGPFIGCPPTCAPRLPPPPVQVELPVVRAPPSGWTPGGPAAWRVAAVTAVCSAPAAAAAGWTTCDTSCPGGRAPSHPPVRALVACECAGMCVHRAQQKPRCSSPHAPGQTGGANASWSIQLKLASRSHVCACSAGEGGVAVGGASGLLRARRGSNLADGASPEPSPLSGVVGRAHDTLTAHQIMHPQHNQHHGSGHGHGHGHRKAPVRRR